MIHSWHLALAVALGGAIYAIAARQGLSPEAALLAGGGLLWGAVALFRRHKAGPDAEQSEAEAPTNAFPAGMGRVLLERMPAPMIVISENERLVYANAAARTILPKATLGAHYSSMIRAPGFVQAIDTVLEEREGLNFEFTLMMERKRYFEARATIQPGGEGGFGEEDQIVIHIEDRTRDRTSLKARTDFVANASHELRTPLASILGYIETLQGHAKDDPEAQELFLDIMMKQASRMQRLVDDLMNLSRIEMNAHIRPDEQLDLYAVAYETANALFPLATKNDVLLQIEFSADEPGPMVLGDRDQLAQVIINLVDNAIKYGGTDQKVRVVAAEPSPKYPAHTGITVIDNGPGIAREHVHRLTERFFRVNVGKSRDSGGTGLGLAITKHILNRHSGALGIESVPGEGSRFTLWLPVVEAAQDLQDSSEKVSESMP